MALQTALDFPDEVDLQVGARRRAAEEVVAHQAVEVEGRRGARVDLERPSPPASVDQVIAADGAAVSSVTSSGVPSAWSTSTCTSLLLSKGSIFMRTAPAGHEADRPQEQDEHEGQEARAAPSAPLTSAFIVRR